MCPWLVLASQFSPEIRGVNNSDLFSKLGKLAPAWQRQPASITGRTDDTHIARETTKTDASFFTFFFLFACSQDKQCISHQWDGERTRARTSNGGGRATWPQQCTECHPTYVDAPGRNTREGSSTHVMCLSECVRACVHVHVCVHVYVCVCA